MSSLSLNKNRVRLSSLDEIDWLKRHFLREKLCHYCGNNLIKNQEEYCSKECYKLASVWRFGD